jgi:hypothetical protein
LFLKTVYAEFLYDDWIEISIAPPEDFAEFL